LVSAAARIRPLRDDDVEAACAVAWDAISAQVPEEFLTAPDAATRARRIHARARRFLELDPGGCWVADVAGAPVGLALSLRREGVWGLSLFGVAPELQAQGIGKPLLEAALGHAEGCRGGVIASTLDPRALRRYALAGFDLHPTLAACRIVDRECAPDLTALRSREVTWEDPALIAAATDVSRAVRGAAHASDLEGFAADEGTPIVLDGSGWAIRDDDGSPTILAARDEDAATDLLWACLLGGTSGATIHVDFLSGGQNWATRVALQAGLPLSPDGVVCVRGETGPMAPYLISGVYL